LTNAQLHGIILPPNLFCVSCAVPVGRPKKVSPLGGFVDPDRNDGRRHDDEVAGVYDGRRHDDEVADVYVRG